jgi:uncharacterized membrane protein
MFLGVGIGMLFVVLGVPLFTRKIPPNPLYGLRTSATCDDEWVWYEANAKSGRELMIGGTALIAISIVLELAKVSEGTANKAFGIAAGVLTLSLAIRGVRTANRLKLLRDHRAADET